MTNLWQSYGKAVVQVLGAAAVALAAAWSDGDISRGEAVQIVATSAGILSVWLTANVGVPFWNYSKAVASFIAAAAGLVAGYYAAGENITGSMWLNAFIAGLTAVGVIAAPAESKTT